MHRKVHKLVFCKAKHNMTIKATTMGGNITRVFSLIKLCDKMQGYRYAPSDQALPPTSVGDNSFSQRILHEGHIRIICKIPRGHLRLNEV